MDGMTTSTRTLADVSAELADLERRADAVRAERDTMIEAIATRHLNHRGWQPAVLEDTQLSRQSIHTIVEKVRAARDQQAS